MLAKLGQWQCMGEKESERGGILQTEVAGFVKRIRHTSDNFNKRKK